MENNGTSTRERGFSARPQRHDGDARPKRRPLRVGASIKWKEDSAFLHCGLWLDMDFTFGVNYGLEQA